MQRLAALDTRVKTALILVALTGASVIYTQLLLPGPKGGSGTPMAIVFEYLLLGVLNGLFACLLVMIYRVQQFIDFASPSIGSVAAIFGTALIRLTPAPFYVAVPAGLVAGAILGALFELLFVRRFFNAPRLTLTVMSALAISALISVLLNEVLKLPFFPRLSTVDPQVLNGPLRPLLPFPGFHFQVGTLKLEFGFGAIYTIWTAVILLAGLGYFFRYTRTGIASRALAENPGRAELLGISTRRISTTVWVLAGVVASAAGMAAIFLDSSATATGRNLDALLAQSLVPFVAAVVGRLRSFPVTMVVGVLLTVLSGALTYSYPGAGSVVTGLLFVVLCVSLVVQRRTILRSEAQTVGGWESSDEIRPIPAELADVSVVRGARWALIALAIGGVGLFPFIFSTRLTALAGGAILFAIAALSLVVLTGWAGQVSLGQVAFVAIGALVGGSLMSKSGVPFIPAVVLAAAITGVAALIVGIPALRVRGLFLAIVTFAFSLAVAQLLFDPTYVKWLQPKAVGRPKLFFIDFADDRSMYYLALGALLVVVVVVVNLRRSRFGRLLIAMRENEAAVQAVGVSVVRLKLTAFVVSGAMAGFAGAIFAAQQRGVSGGDFGAFQSLNLFSFTIVGGVTSVAGALIGQTLNFVIAHNAVNNDIYRIVESFLPLGVLYFFPAGAMGVFQTVRDSFLRVVAQRRQIVVPSLFADFDVHALRNRVIPLAPRTADDAVAEVYSRPSILYRDGVTNGGSPQPDRTDADAIAAAAGAVDR